jgi:hypothetical protein
LGDDLIHESLPSVLAAMDVGYSREAAMKHASFILKSKTPLLDAELNRILRDAPERRTVQESHYLAAIVANLLRTMHGADPVGIAIRPSTNASTRVELNLRICFVISTH